MDHLIFFIYKSNLVMSINAIINNKIPAVIFKLFLSFGDEIIRIANDMNIKGKVYL